MAGYTEITIDSGSDYSTDITVIDSTTGVALNLATYNVSSQLRRSYYSRNPTANFVCTITDSANGNINIALTGANTANITPGKYVFDVLASKSGSSLRVIEGLVIITPRVTR